MPAAQKGGAAGTGPFTFQDTAGSSQKLWLLSNLPDSATENQLGFQKKSLNDLKKIYQNCASKE